MLRRVGQWTTGACTQADNACHCATPGLHNKISVFSDPDPGKYYATTYEQMGS